MGRSKRSVETSLVIIDRFEPRRAAFSRALEKTKARKRTRKMRSENNGVSKDLNRVNDPTSNSAAETEIDLKGRKSILNSELRCRKGRNLHVTQTKRKRVTGKRKQTVENEHTKNKRVDTESGAKKKSQNALKTRLRKRARKEVYGNDGCRAMNEKECRVTAENECSGESLKLTLERSVVGVVLQFM